MTPISFTKLEVIKHTRKLREIGDLEPNNIVYELKSAYKDHNKRIVLNTKYKEAGKVKSKHFFLTEVDYVATKRELDALATLKTNSRNDILNAFNQIKNLFN